MEFQKEMQTLNGMYEIPVGEEIKWSDLWEKLRNRPRTPAIAAITEDRLKGITGKFSSVRRRKIPFNTYLPSPTSMNILPFGRTACIQISFTGSFLARTDGLASTQ